MIWPRWRPFPMIYTTRPGSELTVSAQNLHSEHSGTVAGRHKFPLKQLHIDLMNVPHSYLNQLDSRPPLITVGTLEDRSKGGGGGATFTGDYKRSQIKSCRCSCFTIIRITVWAVRLRQGERNDGESCRNTAERRERETNWVLTLSWFHLLFFICYVFDNNVLQLFN